MKLKEFISKIVGDKNWNPFRGGLVSPRILPYKKGTTNWDGKLREHIVHLFFVHRCVLGDSSKLLKGIDFNYLKDKTPKGIELKDWNEQVDNLIRLEEEGMFMLKKVESLDNSKTLKSDTRGDDDKYANTRTRGRWFFTKIQQKNHRRFNQKKVR